jgi:hypothetical protein
VAKVFVLQLVSISLPNLDKSLVLEVYQELSLPPLLGLLALHFELQRRVPNSKPHNDHPLREAPAQNI